MGIECIEESLFGLIKSEPRLLPPGSIETLEATPIFRDPFQIFYVGRTVIVEDPDTITVRHFFAEPNPRSHEGTHFSDARRMRRRCKEINDYRYDIDKKGEGSKPQKLQSMPTTRADKLLGRRKVIRW